LFCRDLFLLVFHLLRREVRNHLFGLGHEFFGVYFFLEVEEVSIIIGLESENEGVFLARDLFEIGVKREYDEIYLLHILIGVDPAQMVFLFCILTRPESTV
jgi:hypothetical protein